jgi:hypothetical protein
VLLENGIVMVIVREREEERKEQKERNRKDTAWQEKEKIDGSDPKNNSQSYDHIKMAKNLDKLSFGFCLIMFLLFNVLFWSLYLKLSLSIVY